MRLFVATASIIYLNIVNLMFWFENTTAALALKTMVTTSSSAVIRI